MLSVTPSGRKSRRLASHQHHSAYKADAFLCLNQSGWLDLNQRSHAPDARASTRLSHTLKIESAQRESNPHIRHGKAVGCRYIMGT